MKKIGSREFLAGEQSLFVPHDETFVAPSRQYEKDISYEEAWITDDRFYSPWRVRGELDGERR